MGQPSLPVDPLASERLELLGRTAGAQIEVERLIASLRASATPIPPDIAAQQSELASLMREIATAGPAELPALQRAVAAAIASATNAVQQVQSAQSGQGASALADAVEASHRAVQSALDYTRSLNLQFASAEDEKAYREREAERRAYIEAGQAKATPEGNLNAAGATIGQMADAKAQGASGPEFDQHVNELLETTAKLREAIRRSGKSTQEFDDRLRADLRRIMQAKGMTDAEIDAKFAVTPDPLEAAKAYLTDKDVQTVNADIQRNRHNVGATRSAMAAPEPPPEAAIGATDAMAELRAAGISMTSPSPDTTPSHGLAVAVAPASKGRSTA